MTTSCPPPAPPEPVVELCGQSPVTSLTFGQTEADGLQSRCITLFSGHQDGKIIEWNLTSCRPVTSWKGHTESVLWLKWVMDKLLSQGRDGVMQIWSCSQSTEMIWTCIGAIKSAALTFCNSAICSRDSEYVLTVPSDNTAEVNVHILRESTFSPNDSIAKATACSDTSGPLTLNSVDKPPPLLVETFSHVLKPTPVKQYAMCMKMCSVCTKSGHARLLVSHESGSLLLWDVLKGILLNEIKAHEESIMCMDVCSIPSTGTLKCVTGSVDNTLKSWHITEDKIAANTTVSVTNSGFSDIAIRRDGRIFASGGWDHMGRLFSLNKLRPLAVLSYHRGSVQSVAFAADNTLASGSKDGYIALWKLYMDK